jgi:succinate dehydrogenase flavin-adding protein (antitoxin of CptAB toxin-antitoxin module)/heme-degrading monooxygenase HmoA
LGTVNDNKIAGRTALGDPSMPIAELNIARLKAPLEDPATKEFADNLERINGMAERMPGFIWRLKGEGSNATDLRIDDSPDVIVNVSVWESLEALEAFVFKTAHARFFQRRAEWFHLMDRPHFVMWPVAAGHYPSLAEAKERLEHLGRHGDTEQAYGWVYARKVAAAAAAENDAVHRRRLLYRATHRGTREMDWLLGKFGAARMDTWPAGDLPQLSVLIEMPDPDLHAWILDPALRADDPLLRMITDIRAFHGLDAEGACAPAA